VTSYRAVSTSAFPRSEELVQATRDLDRGRTSPEAVEATFARAGADVEALERRLGLSGVTGGFLRWQDLFRPFAEVWDGVQVGALTRFFETNTFYRQPVLSAAARPRGKELARWLPHGPRSRALLPGPYTFGAMAEVAYAPAVGGSVVQDLGSALSGTLRALGDDAPEQLQFQEPMLTYRPPAPRECDAIVAAYRAIREAVPTRSLAVWTYFGDAGPAWPLLTRLPVDVVGFDLFETELPRGPPLGGPALGIGCIDSRTTSPEDAEAVAKLVRAAAVASGASTVKIGPSPPLELLPWTAAVTKLELLPRLVGALAP
jgi:5-methyltetrahydropteroyltriglutamate--homocysteine methyltransferase